jgi:S1-C subfamily serine protease
VGVSEPVYKPGVKLGDIKETTVAGRAGLRRGDVILAVDGQLVAPRPGSVSTVVNAIK